MVGNHHHALWKRKLNPTILRFLDLICHRGIPAYAYRGGAPPVCGSCDQQPKRLFRQSHIGVVDIVVDVVQRRADQLCKMDTAKTLVNDELEEGDELKRPTQYSQP